MTIDERIEALTANLELASHEIEELKGTVESLAATSIRNEKRQSKFEVIVLRLGAHHAERLRLLENEAFGDDEKPEAS